MVLWKCLKLNIRLLLTNKSIRQTTKLSKFLWLKANLRDVHIMTTNTGWLVLSQQWWNVPSHVWLSLYSFGWLSITFLNSELGWFPIMAQEPSLPCYLTYSQWEKRWIHIFSKGIWVKVDATNSAWIWTWLTNVSFQDANHYATCTPSWRVQWLKIFGLW